MADGEPNAIVIGPRSLRATGLFLTRKESHELLRLHVYVHGVPTDDGRNSCVFNGARTIKSTRTIIFLPRTLRQSLSRVLIPFPCVLPGSREEFCQWCALVRCSPFCLTFLFVPFAPRHHTSPSRRRAARCVVACSLDSVWSLAIAGVQRTGAVCRACDVPHAQQLPVLMDVRGCQGTVPVVWLSRRLESVGKRGAWLWNQILTCSSCSSIFPCC